MKIGPFVALFCMAALSACTSTPGEPLATRIEGKTPDERQEILRRACLTEANWDSDWAASRQPIAAQNRYRNSNTTLETRHLRELCREMAALPAIQGRSPIETRRRADVAEKCRREIDDHLDIRSQGSADHMLRMQEICEAMTGFALPAQED
jgi:hypothetical protein